MFFPLDYLQIPGWGSAAPFPSISPLFLSLFFFFPPCERVLFSPSTISFLLPPTLFFFPPFSRVKIGLVRPKDFRVFSLELPSLSFPRIRENGGLGAGGPDLRVLLPLLSHFPLSSLNI